MMSRKTDLEHHLRASAQLIQEYEEIIRLSDNPKEKLRSRRVIEEQWALITGYLDEYIPLCHQRQEVLAEDIRDMAARFPAYAGRLGCSVQPGTPAPPEVIPAARPVTSRLSDQPVADLEIWLQRRDESTHTAVVTLRPPGSPVDEALISGAPPLVHLEHTSLLPLALHPQKYGAALTRMLFADPRMPTALVKAQQRALGASISLRLRLRLDAHDPAIHSVRWETLHDPTSPTPTFLCTSAHLLFSRYLASADANPVYIGPQTALTALVAIAAPTNLPEYGLAAINREQEAAAIRLALPGIAPTVLERTSLTSLMTALLTGPTILYLVCHGTIRNGEAYLCLEDDAGQVAWIAGQVLAERVRALAQRPLLVVLAACQSAGQSNRQSEALVAPGPHLAQAGIGAVVAMHDQIAVNTLAVGMPVFFHELQQHGQVDRAMAAMRNLLATRGDDWWQPVLFLRLRDGKLWTSTPEQLLPQQLGLDRPPAERYAAIQAQLDATPRGALFAPGGLCAGYPLTPAPNEFFVAHETSAEKIADLRDALEQGFAGQELTPYTADQDIRPSHRLCKIAAKIQTTAFCIFDLPASPDRNVYLELGIALSLGRPFVLTRRADAALPDLLASLDIFGFTSYSGLRRELAAGTRLQVGQFSALFPQDTVPVGNTYVIADGGFEQEDFREAITHALHGYGLEPVAALDHQTGAEMALTQLLRTIQSARFGIYRIDASASAETFLALGLTIGLAKPWILVSRQGAAVPVDVRGLSQMTFQNFLDLERNVAQQCRHVIPSFA
jgi:hypothetical protein